MDSEKLYDLSYINQIAKDNTALLEKLCSTFIISASKDLAALEAASQTGDIEMVHKASHPLKTALAAMNAHEATTLITLIDKSAKLKVNTEEIPDMVERAGVIIRAVIAQVKNDLQL